MKKIFLLLFLPLQLCAQLTMHDFKNYAFPTELKTGRGNRIAWAMDEKGVRNVYAAAGPDFAIRKVTAFTQNDGQEITSLQFSPNGEWIVFVRGGDHGANYDALQPIQVAGESQPAKVAVWSVPFAGGPARMLSEGDAPTIHPNNQQVTFIKSGQVFQVSIQGSAAAKSLFTTKGNIGALEWTSDTTNANLLFVANRNDHSLIGLYRSKEDVIQWVAPSFSRDQSPRWSPDGKKIVFIRRPGTGGQPDSMLVKPATPWQIVIADPEAGTHRTVWESAGKGTASFPTTHGGANLHWAAGDQLVFLSYQDGWPHLYRLPTTGGKETLLTPGNFMCEHISMSADRTRLTFSANAGKDANDIERRHAASVAVDGEPMQVLTPGTDAEWMPVSLSDGKSVALISATASRPPLPAILPLSDKKIQLLGVKEWLSPEFPSKEFVTPIPVTFKAADGVVVHAQMFRQPGISGKRPAIVYVHGGPPRQMLLSWHYSDYYSNAYASNQYLAHLGFVVLSVNYRLGIGYGYAFHQPAKGGAMGASEYQDIKAAGQWLQQQSFIDPQRIGIYGGSYGGYLTALALARDSKIFAAGVDIHGVHDWTIQASLNAQNDKYEKAPDRELALKTAWSSSPISDLRKWTSPVMIIHADDDRNVRFNQSVDLVNRLTKRKIPMETMMIPDDTHHWMNHNNAVGVYQSAADFFVKKLKP